MSNKYCIEILFKFKGVFFIEKINLGNVDPDHYEKLWDWWFESKNNDLCKRYDFELTGIKVDKNHYSLENLYIQVYPEGKDHLIKRIENVFVRRSWMKENTFTDSRKLKNNKNIKIKL